MYSGFPMGAPQPAYDYNAGCNTMQPTCGCGPATSVAVTPLGPTRDYLTFANCRNRTDLIRDPMTTQSQCVGSIWNHQAACASGASHAPWHMEVYTRNYDCVMPVSGGGECNLPCIVPDPTPCEMLAAACNPLQPCEQYAAGLAANRNCCC